MSKLQRFKRRAAKHGQTISLYTFSAWPSGDYLDAWSGEPDPDDADYPAAVPSPAYAEAVSVAGFFQPSPKQVGGASPQETLVRAPWGEEVEVAAIFYCPGDQAVTVNDKIVYGGTTYYAVTVSPWRDGATLVHVEVLLTESVPRAS